MAEFFMVTDDAGYIHYLNLESVAFVQVMPSADLAHVIMNNGHKISLVDQDYRIFTGRIRDRLTNQ